jgi:hypothetical protein
MERKQSDRILLVATTNQIKIFFLVLGAHDHSFDLVDSKYGVPTD